VLWVVFFGCESAWANLVIYSKTPVQIELTGYNSMTESSIFLGSLAAGDKREINTPYRGLVLLVFDGGQRYPVIIGDESFTLNIADPGKPLFFAGSDENTLFYKLLSGGDSAPGQYNFAHLMI
jgi:hypothetical protein